MQSWPEGNINITDSPLKQKAKKADVKKNNKESLGMSPGIYFNARKLPLSRQRLSHVNELKN